MIGGAHGVRPFAVLLSPTGVAAFCPRRPRTHLPFLRPHPPRPPSTGSVGCPRLPSRSGRNVWAQGSGGRGSWASAPSASRTAREGRPARVDRRIVGRAPAAELDRSGDGCRDRPYARGRRGPRGLDCPGFGRPLSGFRARPAGRPDTASGKSPRRIPGAAAVPRPRSRAPDSRGSVVCAGGGGLAGRARHLGVARPAPVPARRGGLVVFPAVRPSGPRPPLLAAHPPVGLPADRRRCLCRAPGSTATAQCGGRPPAAINGSAAPSGVFGGPAPSRSAPAPNKGCRGGTRSLSEVLAPSATRRPRPRDSRQSPGQNPPSWR